MNSTHNTTAGGVRARRAVRRYYIRPRRHSAIRRFAGYGIVR